VEAYYQLAWVYVAKGQWKKAEDSVSRFLIVRPGSADGLYVRGYALFRLGKYDGAIALLQKSLGIKSDNADAHKILGLCFFQKNENDLAERELTIAIKLNPGSAETQYFSDVTTILSIDLTGHNRPFRLPSSWIPNI